MAVDVPASSSDADRRLEEDAELRVADRSPVAAEAAGVSRSEARRGSVTRVVTPTISVRKRLHEIWLSRELLIYLVRTEIKVKYKNSVLGLVWSMVGPGHDAGHLLLRVLHPAGQQDAELRHLSSLPGCCCGTSSSWAS